MLPVIGIPLCLDAEERIRPGREYLYIDFAYARAIERAGGIPLQLPIQAEPAVLVERIDGLLLPGGDDFLPAGEVDDPGLYRPAPTRQLDFDRGLLDAALERGIPILGICYGAQLLALEFGGQLHYHLPRDLPEAQDHQLPELDGRHELAVEDGSRLASILGGTSVSVNSLHHQAIASPGSGLNVSGLAPDGVIEAIEASDDRYLLGVQWHPEKLACPASDALFSSLIAAAGATQGA